jgi:hypothetical protein
MTYARQQLTVKETELQIEAAREMQKLHGANAKQTDIAEAIANSVKAGPRK